MAIWHDSEGNLLEVVFERREQYSREMDGKHAVEKVDEDGQMLGFGIVGLRRMKDGRPPLALT